MPRQRAIAGLAGLLAMACLGAFMVQPELLKHLSRSGHQQQLRHSGEGTAAPVPAPAPAPTPDMALTLAQLPTPAPVVPAFAFDYPLVVEKKAVSSRMRIVFLVGLEGTGHHYLADVLESMCKTASVPCPKVCLVAKALYPGTSIPKSAGDYERARRDLRTEMETLATFEEEQLPEGKATMASFGACRFEAGMMSYPNFNGQEKTLQYVDFRLLAEEAERAGVDVRFVFLTRSARSILVSDTEHNNYGGSFMRESRILLNNAAVVESIFRELGPGFTTCFRYEDMPDPNQARRVAQFVAPTDYVAERLERKMLENVRIRAPPQGAKGSAARAQWEKQQQKQDKDKRYRRGDSRNDPRLEDYRNRQFNRAGGAGGAEDAAAAADMSGKVGEGGIVLSGNSAKDLVIARLQQKIDQIERGVCLSPTNGTSNDTA